MTTYGTGTYGSGTYGNPSTGAVVESGYLQQTAELSANRWRVAAHSTTWNASDIDTAWSSSDLTGGP